MADVKISALPLASTPLTGTEVLPIVQSATTDQVTVANLTAGRAVSASSLTLTTTPLAVGSGGTGATAFTANYIPYSNGTILTSSANLVFDGTNLGVGAASPAAPLSFASATGQKIRFYNALSGYGIGVESSEFRFVADSGAKFTWLNGTYSGGSTYMTLDASGNLGLGVTPSAWLSSYRAIQLGVTASIFGRTGNEIVGLTSNAYATGSNSYSYIVGGNVATAYTQDTGFHKWFTTGTTTGSAGGAISFTQAMTLDASGNLGIGTVGPGARLHVDSATSADQIRISNGAGATVYYRIGRNTSTGFMDFYGSQTGFTGYVFGGVDGERARIDASGNLLVTGSSGGLGYGTGSGGTATQGSSSGKGTGVTLNKIVAQITMNNAALAANTEVGFVITNSFVTTNDNVIISLVNSGTASMANYNIRAAITTGGIIVYLKNISGGSLSDAVVFNFTVIKGAIS